MLAVKDDNNPVAFSVITLVDTPTQLEKIEIANFIHSNAEGHLDSKENIIQCLEYAIGDNRSNHGFVVVGRDASDIGDQGIVAAAVINNTGMGGYIPENILVYFVVHPDFISDNVIAQMMDKISSFAKGELSIRLKKSHPYRKNFIALGFDDEFYELRRA